MPTIVKNAARIACAISILTLGCAHQPHTNTATKSDTRDPNSSVGDDKDTRTIDLPPSSIGGQIKTVYFDYDSYALHTDALKRLRDNAAILTGGRRTAEIQIEGHCDERGTQEYNLALGEQRALAVRHHLAKLGVDASRMTTISYGEERPADNGHSEMSYALNRRCEFNVTAP